MVRHDMWVSVRALRLALLALATASMGCSLVLDTTPTPDGGLDPSECTIDEDCGDTCLLYTSDAADE